MPRRLALTLSVLALSPAAASAQVTATAVPNTAGAPSHLKIAVDGASPAFAGRLPRAMVLSLDAGFAVDVLAAQLCGDSDASNGVCQAGAEVARGTAVVEASFAGAPGSDVTATVTIFNVEGKPAGALAGLLVALEAQGQKSTARGALYQVATAPFGYEVRFDQLPAPSAPAGVTLKFKRMDLDIGRGGETQVATKRSVRCKSSSRSKSCKRKKSCRRGRRCPRYRTVRRVKTVHHDLLRNPRACAGTWAARMVVAFDDGTSATGDAPIACTP